ncbi:MAG: hypothetical protein GY713_01950 [Actinomycetia bacterium]|nr:hypothetical protein [Actinomycetes bacterium]
MSDTSPLDDMVEPVEITPSIPGPIKRHPIRGALWGLVGGIGMAMVLISRAVIALGTLTPLVVIALVMVLGVAWAYVAPPKKAPA